jgi:hypothetical protein
MWYTVPTFRRNYPEDGDTSKIQVTHCQKTSHHVTFQKTVKPVFATAKTTAPVSLLQRLNDN